MWCVADEVEYPKNKQDGFDCLQFQAKPVARLSEFIPHYSKTACINTLRGEERRGEERRGEERGGEERDNDALYQGAL